MSDNTVREDAFDEAASILENFDMDLVTFKNDANREKIIECIYSTVCEALREKAEELKDERELKRKIGCFLYEGRRLVNPERT